MSYVKTKSDYPIYLDSSAIVKLVVNEPGGLELREWLSGRPRQVSSELALTEVRLAARRHGEDFLKVAELVLRTMNLRRLKRSTLLDAGNISHNLKSLDAIHLAAAIELTPYLNAFVTYDRRLAEAARSHDLAVYCPGTAA